MKSILQQTGMAIVILVSAFITTQVAAKDSFVFWPEADYDPSIPSVEDVLGYRSGERITWASNAVRYFEALAKAAPERISVHRYANSWEGRELIYVVVFLS